MRRRLQLLISGRVQGVAYRWHAREAAQRLALDGFVRNLADGNVELVAEGEEEPLRSLLEWCRKGPPQARVLDVRADWLESAGETAGFRIGR